MIKNGEFPYIGGLIKKVCNGNTPNNIDFTYHNRYEVTLQSSSQDYFNIYVRDLELNGREILDIDFDYLVRKVTINYTYNIDLKEQVIDEFGNLYFGDISFNDLEEE